MAAHVLWLAILVNFSHKINGTLVKVIAEEAKVESEAMTKNRNQIRQRKKKRWPISTNCDQTTQKKEAKWAKQVCWSREGWWVGSLIMCMLESESHADLIHACECHVQVLWWRMGRDMQWWVCWRKTVLVVWSHWRKEIKIAMRKGLPQLRYCWHEKKERRGCD